MVEEWRGKYSMKQLCIDVTKGDISWNAHMNNYTPTPQGTGTGTW